MFRARVTGEIVGNGSSVTQGKASAYSALNAIYGQYTKAIDRGRGEDVARAFEAYVDQLEIRLNRGDFDANSDLKVVRAAIRDNLGGVHSVPIPARHHHVIRNMVEAGLPKPIRGEQGFIISDGSFRNRALSEIVAKQAGQITRIIGGALTSEDLW